MIKKKQNVTPADQAAEKKKLNNINKVSVPGSYIVDPKTGESQPNLKDRVMKKRYDNSNSNKDGDEEK